MPIRNEAEYNQWRQRRDAAFNGAVRDGLQMSFDQLRNFARSSAGTSGIYKDRTGNLRASTGIDENIPAPPYVRVGRSGPRANRRTAAQGQTRLALSVPRGVENVHRVPTGWVMFFGIGMEYAKWVHHHALRRGDNWVLRLSNFGIPACRRNVNDAVVMAMRSVGLQASVRS